MFARMVSLLAMTAIIACPLWCSAGLCQTGECCASMQGSYQSGPQASVGCCDGCSSKQHQQEHTPCPGKSVCQGVCGGAIFQKPCQIDGTEAVAFVPLPAPLTQAAAGSLTFPDYWNPAAEHSGGSAANVGRSLRALHMSFLC